MKTNIVLSEDCTLKEMFEYLKKEEFIKLISIKKMDGTAFDGFINVEFRCLKDRNKCFVCGLKKTNMFTKINSEPVHIHFKCWRGIKDKYVYNKKKRTYLEKDGN